MGGGDHADGIALVIPGELLPDMHLCSSGKVRRFRSQRQRIFALRVGEPGACAVVHHGVPLIPAALIVLIKDAADHNKRFVTVLAFGIDLNRRAVRREIGDLADFPQVHIRADEDAFAIFANGLDATGPAKNDLGTAVGTVSDGLAHRRWPARIAVRGCASVTGDLLPFGFVRPLQPADRNGMRLKKLTENSFKIPLRARNAAEEIETERTVLRKGVAREMRLGQQAKAGDPSGTGKLMPLGFADGPELHFPNEPVEQIPQNRRITQRLRRASKGFDNPFDSAHSWRGHLYLGFAALRTEFGAASDRLAALGAEFCFGGRNSRRRGRRRSRNWRGS